MKCEKCGNEAVYYYKETINGKTTEKHLCADCAKEEGLDRAFDRSGESFFRDFDRELESFFAPDPFFGGFLGDGFFSRSPFETMARTMLRPMLTFPRIEIGMTAPEKTSEKAGTAQKAPETPEDKACEALQQRRELNALRHRLQEAVKAENYEEAITLRDRIKAMEKDA